ncbi:ABC transporter ATP-binding protein/permease [Colwellia sp. MB02u-18]|uniref:ABCB family ABC transporter ATP-binding protein/permease n=1 Tax=unclassified Colwellia TaxID=196834 RepID=UPI0015F3BF14|nr:MULTISPECIES: ABC transporter ATP-binding protein/permease [unclassified Colwellia]MBA6224128.1 ABC transporter ATP-binding protein/permease [Colwellia sp. MB3u-45]MBA6268980.1 ABC transporter ATP-binding protein/permease [Colwellia sp. MB3u-43]MBA6320934.1 ABC transporter ATP-binding protein/permease [Colwellia sp. MB02u-19]MBA6324214.1 ABC transporter ATP-binding protein/permease [Colwellia sp. MB02u-18]MBA6332763.1 ABC transporter ATP-binding protein/permease [Colwellia sp. MB02u-12]
MRRSSHQPDHEVTTFNWRVVKLLLPYLFEFKARIFLALACLVLTKVASVYLPFILKDIVDILDNQEENRVYLVPFALVGAYGLVRLTTVIFAEIRDTLFGRVTERAIRRIGLKVFQHLHKLDLDFHLNRQTGGLSRDIDRGTSGINFLMRFMVFNIIPTLIEIIMVVGILFFNYGIWFALITLSSIVFYVVYSVYATDWRTRFIREANKADSSSNTRAIDSLLNYETVKYFTNEDFEAKAYDSQLATWEQAKMKNRLSLFALNGGQALIISFSMTAMLALAAYEVTYGKMTLGDFVLINAFMMQLFIPLNFLGFVYREIRGSLANIEHMFDLMLKKPKVEDNDDADTLALSDAEIKFTDVSFAYDIKRPIIKNISFTIKSGQKVAVVGESGSGKSTLVKLLFRFYDCDSGKITIDGQNIRQVTQHSLRKNIGIVPQDTVLFNDTLFANVNYGAPEANEEMVHKAFKLAHLSDFVSRLPDGAKSMVGERGLKLSGGEKQRVAIARTILKNPRILVFDEATSSLDSQSEQAILSAIKEVAEHRTSLVIAHRLSTIVDADNIIVMQQGEIVEQGTHQGLLVKKGHYHKMWQLQQSDNS